MRQNLTILLLDVLVYHYVVVVVVVVGVERLVVNRVVLLTFVHVKYLIALLALIVVDLVVSCSLLVCLNLWFCPSSCCRSPSGSDRSYRIAVVLVVVDEFLEDHVVARVIVVNAILIVKVML